MDTCRPCGCKGCRTCLICEQEFGIHKPTIVDKQNGTYVYCPFCNKAYPGWDLDDYAKHPNHAGDAIDYPGVYIQLDFLTRQEEGELLNSLDDIPWDLSQSGRRKQNFGPKCNFKKRKLKLGDFEGFPRSTEFVQKKFTGVELLKGFQTIEQCTLEYDAKRGASIDPHIDDCWIWGERIVTVNLLSDSVLTMTYNSKPDGYNLKEVAAYPSIVTGSVFNINHVLGGKSPVVRIPMPRLSLLVMYGSARYEWEHQVLRDDIEKKRICLAYREFTPPYLKNGDKYDESMGVFEKASQFF